MTVAGNTNITDYQYLLIDKCQIYIVRNCKIHNLRDLLRFCLLNKFKNREFFYIT